MKELDLTKGSVLKTLLQFAVPFLIANLLQALYGGADLFVVGFRYVGVSYASYLKKNKLTLEELYGVNQKADENTPKVDVENPDEYETSPSSPAPNQ